MTKIVELNYRKSYTIIQQQIRGKTQRDSLVLCCWRYRVNTIELSTHL